MTKIDFFAIPPKFQRQNTRTIAETLALTELPKRRMKFPKTKVTKPKPFTLDAGSRLTLLEFGWGKAEIANIKSKKERDAALDTITNPATWKTHD